MKNKSKKAQIEIFGLAVIVILVSIGFFIFVSIRSQEPKSNPQKEFTNDKIANDFVLAILDTSVDGCTEYSIKDLVRDCARDNRIKCAGKDSCIALNESVTYMLNETFMKRNTKFRFYSENLIYYPPNIGTGTSQPRELFNVSYLGCSQYSTQGQRGVAIVSLYPITKSVYLNINICH